MDGCDILTGKPGTHRHLYKSEKKHSWKPNLGAQGIPVTVSQLYPCTTILLTHSNILPPSFCILHLYSSEFGVGVCL